MSTIKDKITIQDMRSKGISLIPGNKYIPKALIPRKVPSLSDVRRRLSKIKGSLSETIAEAREE